MPVDLFFVCAFIMHLSSRSADLANVIVVSVSQPARRGLADHVYAAPSLEATRRPHASIQACATASTWLVPVVPVCVWACLRNVVDARR